MIAPLVGDWHTYEVIGCPLCDYLTGVHRGADDHDHALGRARDALVNHLCRMRHALLRREARALAKPQAAQRARWNDTRGRYELIAQETT